MESHGQALEQEYRFPGVFCHCGDSPVYLSYQLQGDYGHLSCHAPAVSFSMATDRNVNAVYLCTLFRAALRAAARGLVAVLVIWDSACRAPSRPMPSVCLWLTARGLSHRAVYNVVPQQAQWLFE